MEKGWIALDIDGTITLDKYSVPIEVKNYLKTLHESGWKIALATGRPYAFALIALSQFDFPYFFLLQNGSAALEMPEKKFLFKRYISPEALPDMEWAYRDVDSDFLIYAGYEKGDFCYWRPQRMSEEDLRYLEDLRKRQKEEWVAVDRFDPEQIGSFPLIKCFGSKEKMEKIAGRLKSRGRFEVAMLRDPFEPNGYLLLVTDRNVSKGQSLLEVFRMKGRGERVIVAGDDENDISLFEVADTKIAMSHAPESLLQKADLVAPPTKEQGIIRALQMVLGNHGHRT